MKKSKCKYLIGVEDKKGNLYLVTRMEGNIIDFLFPIKVNEDFVVPAVYLFPYHTFPKDSSLNKTQNLQWTLIKTQMIVDGADEKEHAKNSFIVKDAEIHVVEKIVHPLGIAKSIISTMLTERRLDITSILNIRDRLLGENSLFAVQNAGEITNYLDLLSCSSEDTSINLLISRNHLFPLTLFNLPYYPSLLSKGIPIDYSLIVGPKPFGVGDDFICPSVLESFSPKDIVTLYKNCPELYVSFSNFIKDREFAVEAINQGAIDLIRTFLSSSTRDLKELKDRIDELELLKTMSDHFTFFCKEPVYKYPETDKDISWQVHSLMKILPLTNYRCQPFMNRKFDRDKVDALIEMGAELFMESLSTGQADASLSSQENETKEITYYNAIKGSGKLCVKNKRFILCEGSVLNRIPESMKYDNDGYLYNRNNGLIDDCLNDGTALKINGEIILQKDVTFGSPAFPATLVYGKWIDGWKLFAGLSETVEKKERKKRTVKR